MKRKNILIGLIIILIFSVPIGGYFYSTKYNDWVKSQPKKYAYIYYKGADSPAAVIVLQSLDYKRGYLDYYREVEKGNNPHMPNNIQIVGIPYRTQIYIIGYTEDSSLAKFVCYENQGSHFFFNGWAEGYVYVKALHENQPPDSTYIKSHKIIPYRPADLR